MCGPRGNPPSSVGGSGDRPGGGVPQPEDKLNPYPRDPNGGDPTYGDDQRPVPRGGDGGGSGYTGGDGGGGDTGGGGGGGGTGSVLDILTAEARDARAREELRQARIRTGNTALDTQFGQFDDNFYGGRRKAFLDFYSPQVEDKFKKAQDSATFALARAGTSNSSMAGDVLGDLLKEYALQKGSIVAQSEADIAGQRSRIGQEKSALISQLNATGDAERVSAESLSRTNQLMTERPAYNPLGDIFAGVATGIGNYAQGQNERNLYNSYFGSGKTGSTAGRSRVIK